MNLCTGLLTAALASAAFAQSGATDPVDSPPPVDAAAALPSLDDLLGIETQERPTDVDEDLPHQSALERALSDEQVSDAFRQAIAEMRDVADLLQGRDPGARAQRLQEEILLKLDQLIEQSRQQQQQSSSSSSSSSRQNPTQNQQRAQQQAQQAASGENVSENTPPGGRSGDLNAMVEGSSAAWGALPQRVRDALLQGGSDRFSSLYESLTESYYRRLAEESTRP